MRRDRVPVALVEVVIGPVRLGGAGGLLVVLPLGPLEACGRLGVGGREPFDLVAGRGRPAARGLHLPAQLRQSLPPVGDRLVRGDEGLFGR